MRLPTRLPAIGRVLGYWRAERRTIRHGLIALIVATCGNIVAGISLGALASTLRHIPGLLILLPAAVAMRGSIFGALHSRLGTAIHAGLFEPTRRRGSVLAQNLLAAAVLTVSISWALGILAKAIAVVFGVPSTSLGNLIVISVVGGLLSSVVVGTLATVLSRVAHRRSWDLDSVAPPLVTALGDMVTIPALYVATFLVDIRYVTAGLAVGLTLAALYVSWQGLRTALPAAQRVIRESLPMLLGTSVLTLVAGLAMEARVEHFVAFPALLALVPPLLADVGDLGALLSSRLASKLHLGAIRPRAFPESLAWLDASIALLFGAWIFALVGIAVHFVSGSLGLGSPGLGTILGVSMLAGVGSTLVAVLIAYYTAVATFRIGLDPDNHSIPIITSTVDFVGIIALTLALAAFGLG
jgi:mgtE-like transporter